MEMNHEDLKNVEIASWNAKASPPQWEPFGASIIALATGSLGSRYSHIWLDILKTYTFNFALQHLIEQMSFLFLGKLHDILANDLHLPLAFFRCKVPKANEEPRCGFSIGHLQARTLDMLKDNADNGNA